MQPDNRFLGALERTACTSSTAHNTARNFNGLGRPFRRVLNALPDGEDIPREEANILHTAPDLACGALFALRAVLALHTRTLPGVLPFASDSDV